MKNKSMILYFTRGVSLKEWSDSGILSREQAIYDNLIKKGYFKKIYWITYGSGDLNLSRKLKKSGKLNPNIIILEKKLRLSTKFSDILYSVLLVYFYRKEIRGSIVLKTNQADGSWSAVISKLIFKKFLFVRFGYMLSKSEIAWKRKNFFKILLMILIEKFSLYFANAVTVTSQDDKEYIKNKLNYDKKIIINKSFIDTSNFRDFKIRRKNRALFVGRLSEEKNIIEIINASNKNRLGIDIVGSGKDLAKIKSFANQNKYDINFLGTFPNEEMPILYNSYKYYIIASKSEGLSKTLLEAMACGMICIGANVVGIKNIIMHRKNGFLAKSNQTVDLAKALRQAINWKKKYLIKKNAIIQIKREYSFREFFQREVKIVNTALNL